VHGATAKRERLTARREEGRRPSTQQEQCFEIEDALSIFDLEPDYGTEVILALVFDEQLLQCVEGGCADQMYELASRVCREAPLANPIPTDAVSGTLDGRGVLTE
jgi:hypothetical protein